MEEPSAIVSTPSLSITQCVTLKLSSSNYLLWKTQFESFLSSQSLLGFINGTTMRPSPTITIRSGDTVSEEVNPEFAKWMRKDQLVIAWLFGSLSEEALRAVYGLHSAQDVWVSLGQKYNKVSATRKLDLQRKLQGMTKGQKSMSKYLGDVKGVCDQLDSIGCAITEQEMIYGALSGLGKEYESICTVIEHSMDTIPQLSFEDAVFKLITFDDKLKVYNQSTEVCPHLAFHAGRGYNTRGRGNYNQRGGHRGRGNSSYSTRGRGFQHQFAGGSSANSNTRPTCQICGCYGHSAARCYNRFDQDYQSPDSVHSALTAMTLSSNHQNSGQEWYPDSAASAHITNNTAQLQSSEPYLGDDQVIVGNGDYLPITHVGSISLQTPQGTLPLKDILICPGITKSLLFVSKLTADYPCEFTFDANSVCVKDKATSKVITQGRRHKDLYVLKDSRFQAFYSTRQQATSDCVWHKRLGHTHMEVLQQLSQQSAIVMNKASSRLCCDACHLGKSSNLPFVASLSVSHRPLERIHCDLWGPSPVVSSQGFKYYVIFIDNFSRFAWFYPLKLKSDFFSVFVRFQSLVENQYQHRIGQFQCDGGGEFINKQFLKHLEFHGIKQLLSCPHTPQQNGLSERKHRHITELGITMMLDSKVPQQLWVEAFFTANFIGNLLPSSVLKDRKSPFEVLNGKAPVYTSLRVFGCKCYPYLRPYMKNKFDPKSLVCVFLGYNENYKGYRCLYPPTGRVFISRHVLFDESQFPFGDMYSSYHKPTDSFLLNSWKTMNLHSSIGVSDQDIAKQQEVQVEELPPQFVVVDNPVQELHSSIVQGTPIYDHNHVSESSGSAESHQSNEVIDQAAPVLHPMTTRARVGIVKPNPRYAMVAVKSVYPEPKSIKAALQDPGWKNAMQVEINNMVETGTFELVPPEEGQNPVSCGWVHKTKLDAFGTLLKLRSRLVARGNEQEEGIDFLETFSPVVRTATIRTVLHVDVTKKWKIKQLDVQNAFLHGDLKETVYMTQPPGFVDSTRPDHV